MKRLFQILILLSLFSCIDRRISEYQTILSQVDNIQIEYKPLNKTAELNSGNVKMLKEILTRNIRPTIQRKFKSDTQVNLYSNGEKIGFLMINNDPDLPFVNFCSDKLNFGFQLTYGIGMYLDDIKFNNKKH
jgi:hypothetical protein